MLFFYILLSFFPLFYFFAFQFCITLKRKIVLWNTKISRISIPQNEPKILFSLLVCFFCCFFFWVPGTQILVEHFHKIIIYIVKSISVFQEEKMSEMKINKQNQREYKEERKILHNKINNTNFCVFKIRRQR